MEDTSFLVLVQTLVGKHIKQVQCGEYYTIALTKSGYVFTWGYVFIFRLGHGNKGPPGYPTAPRQHSCRSFSIYLWINFLSDLIM